MPTSPVITAAVKTSRAGDQPDCAAKRALRRTASMKAIATSPNNGPTTSAAGNTADMSRPAESIMNRLETPNRRSLNQTALTDASAIGTIDRMEKCLRIASWAKITPAIGALNPAAIAPATPQPMNTSVVRTPPVA